MCKIVPFAATLSVNVSIITLVAISLDRYYVILYPFRQKLRVKQCIIILFFIWVVSVLMSLFKLLNYGIFVHLEETDVNDAEDATKTHQNQTTATAVVKRKECGPLNERLDDIEVVFLAVMQYIVPFFIISFTYFRIGYHIYFDDSPSSVTQNHSANKRKVSQSQTQETTTVFLNNILICSKIFSFINRSSRWFSLLYSCLWSAGRRYSSSTL